MRGIKSIMSFFLVMALVLSVFGVTNQSKLSYAAEGDDWENAIHINFNQNLQLHKEPGADNKCIYIRIDVPENIIDQDDIKCIITPKNDFQYQMDTRLYDEDHTAMGFCNNQSEGIVRANEPHTIKLCIVKSLNQYITDKNKNRKKKNYSEFIQAGFDQLEKCYIFEKGKSYFIQLSHDNSDCQGDFSCKLTGKQTKISKLTVQGDKKGSKMITASTIPGAMVKLTIKKKAGKTYKKTIESSSSGKAVFKISKLKKGDKITITSKKSGYETKTKKKTIK